MTPSEQNIPKYEAVNLNDENEARFWTAYWNITEKQLYNAVGAVGINVGKIEIWLQKVHESKQQA